MLYLVTERCSDYIHLDIKAIKFMKDRELFSNIEESNNCLKKLYIDRKKISSYKYFNDIEHKINFYFLVKFAYFSFFLNLILCIFLPILLKNQNCKKGLLWEAHIIFGWYLIISFIAEFVVFFIWFSKEARDSFFEQTSKKKTILIFSLYALIGLVAKGDIYTGTL